MSRQSSHDPLLSVIREEQCSPVVSFYNMPNLEEEGCNLNANKTCSCPKNNVEKKSDCIVDEKKLKEQEKLLRAEFIEALECEIALLKDKFDYILQNEQVRASHMLQEAYRDRQEKINALRTQLECKNLAGLMYVMCTERRKSKLEKMRLVQEYSNYIDALQQILSEGRKLILHLSRGYKTAARVDFEWREKMKRVLREFQNFVHHFAGGTPEQNQYFFDLPELLHINAPIHDDLDTDPCETEEQPDKEISSVSSKEEKPWWESLEEDCRPFLMFGDMADFNPPQRREVMRNVKAAKTAPKHWKEYLFHEMFLKDECANTDVIKDEYIKRFPPPPKWECQEIQTQDELHDNRQGHRATSIDIRGKMGSILKIITASSTAPASEPKTVLLGARDSMEIASTTKLREKHKESRNDPKVIINVGIKKEVFMWDGRKENNIVDTQISGPDDGKITTEVEEEVKIDSHNLGSIHHDSLEVIPNRVPDKDHTIHLEKVCPIEKCQRMKADSFMRSLPPYMRSSPFTHFEQTFDEYETCSPEQLELLKHRIEEKKKKDKKYMDVKEVDPLHEWSPDGVGVQTSILSLSLPPCTCEVPHPTPIISNTGVFNVKDLFPVKQALDEIRKECFYDENIEFNRFQVIGQLDSDVTVRHDHKYEDFANTRVQEITKILKKNPSLCDLFQANTKC